MPGLLGEFGSGVAGGTSPGPALDEPFMGIIRYPLPQNNVNSPLPIFGGKHPIFLLHNIY